MSVAVFSCPDYWYRIGLLYVRSRCFGGRGGTRLTFEVKHWRGPFAYALLLLRRVKSTTLTCTFSTVKVSQMLLPSVKVRRWLGGDDVLSVPHKACA